MDKHELADEYISQVLREYDYLNKTTALALALLRACEEILTLREERNIMKEYSNIEDALEAIYEDREANKKKVKDPIKVKARSILRSAIVKGIVYKPKECSKCGDKTRRIEGHHEDYSKPLKVIWLCSKCHWVLHKMRSPGQTPEDAAGEPQSQGGPIIPGDLLSQQDGTVSQADFGQSHGHVVIREPTAELDGLVMCPSCEMPTELNPSSEYRIYCHNLVAPGQFCGYKEQD